MVAQIKVEGLDQLRKELKKLDLTKDLKDANFKTAKMVADNAGAGMLSGRARQTLKASKRAKAATVFYGSDAVPWALGQEFGGTPGKYPPYHGPQFPAIQKDGYNIYPYIKSRSEQIITVYWDAIKVITAKAFPD